MLVILSGGSGVVVGSPISSGVMSGGNTSQRFLIIRSASVGLDHG